MTTINEYIATELKGKIISKKKSPLLGLLLLLAGVGLLVLQGVVALTDTLQTVLLTMGVLCGLVGLALTVVALGGGMRQYVYQPTGSRLTERKVYLSVGDYATAAKALDGGDLHLLSTLHPEVSSNSALHLLRSKDGAIALVQGGRYDTGHFEADTRVVCLFGTEVAVLDMLCK